MEPIKSTSEEGPEKYKTSSAALQKNFISKLIDFFTDEKWKVVTGGLAVFGFLLIPLKEGLFYLIYGEKAVINVNLDKTIILNKIYPVKITIYSESPAPITEGTLEIFDPSNAFEIREGKKIFETPLIKTRKMLPDTGELLLRPMKKGEFSLILQLRTGRAVYNDTITTRIYPVGKPTVYNWSGRWPITIGSNTGIMDLTEGQSTGGVTLNGNYYFYKNGDSTKIIERGSISGERDNYFKVILLEEKQLKRYIINIDPLDPKPINSFIKLSGAAIVYKIKNEQWKKVEKLNFLSSAYID